MVSATRANNQAQAMRSSEFLRVPPATMFEYPGAVGDTSHKERAEMYEADIFTAYTDSSPEIYDPALVWSRHQLCHITLLSD